MKALYYTATEATEYREAPEPQPGPGDALIKIEAVGICGSDMHAWHGHDPRRVPPMILGHEACGTVLDILAPGPAVGERVVINPLITCGTCGYCQSGRSNLCADRELIGMGWPGAFAERVAIPARNLIPVPDGMTPAHAALTEPCATAWHALALAARATWRPIPECSTLVIGGGSVGLLGGLILKAWGASEVCVAETNPARRDTVAAAGLTAFDPLTVKAPDASFDIVLDAVGATATRAASVAATRPGGIIAHVGLQDWAGDFDARTLTLSEITLVGVYTYTDTDLRASLAALHDGRLGGLAWAEERPLADGGQAFRDLDTGQYPAAKIILNP